jgi:LmbE family N-acetylglucosaminyl deacetylase
MDGAVGSVSPHLDDLALSCGSFVAAHPGSVMVTVFAGGPGPVDPLPWWDRECGAFQPGDDVVGIRRAEDLRAAEVLSASARHLGHWDNQYRNETYGYSGPTEDLPERVAADLEPLLAQLNLDRWLVPLGILHPDHRATAEACLLLASRHADVEWLVYEDLPYATLYPRERDLATELVREKGLRLDDREDGCEPLDGPVKRTAVECYPSQMGALGAQAQAAMATPERIHRLSPNGRLTAG